MDREQFWALIEAAKAAGGGDCPAQTAQLVAALREESDHECAVDVVPSEHLVNLFR
jgi:hypothetical protein